MATTVKFSATRCGRNEYHANKWKLSHSNGHFTKFFDKNCRCRRSLILKTFNIAIKFDAVRRMENCTKVILIWRQVRTITYHRHFSKVYKHYLQLLYTIFTTDAYKKVPYIGHSLKFGSFGGSTAWVFRI